MKEAKAKFTSKLITAGQQANLLADGFGVYTNLTGEQIDLT